MPLSDGQLGWAAGFIDADGAIMIVRGNASYQVRLEAYQVSTPALEYLQLLFGGRIKQKPKKIGVIYYWSLTGIAALEPLLQLLPWLVVKKAHASVAIEYLQVCYQQPVSEAVRATFFDGLRTLQVRGRRDA